jgi:hypothetical protein
VPVKNQQPKSPSYTRSSVWNKDLLKLAKADFISSLAIIQYFNSLIAREICFKLPSDINLALEYNAGRQRIAVSVYYLDRSNLFAIARL